ncbi:DUF4416 family protein [Desulfoluna sp.]|uniref:DUF4416 family protein n=1 Tax=Desulfoluna sp. TaxID=2045199 RepID=UPI00261B52BB|nr:DUF4416 family protein [Desulfoluna sp.]
MKPGKTLPAKLVIGVLTEERRLLSGVAAALVGRFGPVDMVSRWMPFSDTSYYKKEMGGPLFRRVFSFSRLVGQETLADIKRCTNTIEDDFSTEGNRRVNLDPGILLHSRFVLASAKDYTHKIYIGKGIFADLTLTYRAGAFRPLPWTFPDYTEPSMIGFLTDVRRRYDVLLHQKKEQIPQW